MKPLRDLIRNPNCTKCPLHKTAEHVCLIGDGPYPAKIMLVGEAPGHREDGVAHKPFAGKSGRVLEIILDTLSLHREDVYITNVVHCRPPDNRTPSMDEIRTCRQYLLKEIKYVNPKIIITFGNVALKGLFESNTYSISRERGKILEFGESKVIPTYHPAAALRKKYFANVIYEDIKNGLERIENKMDIKVNGRGDYKLVDRENVTQVTNELIKIPKISLDVETTGLDSWDKNEELVCVGISPKPSKGYIFKVYQDKWMLKHIQPILDTKELIINQNIKFDLHWLHRYGIDYEGKIFDTLIAKHLLDENAPDKSLKTLARTELGMMDLSSAEDEIIKCRKEGVLPTWKQLVRYNGGDIDAAWRLYEIYEERLEEEGLTKLMAREMRILQALKRIEINGFQVDLKRHKELIKLYEENIAKDEKIIKRILGEINLNSTQQLAKVLYTKRGLNLKCPIITAKGGKSCNEAALKRLLDQKIDTDAHKAVETILDHRTARKIYTTYLIGLQDLVKSDGRIHCSFNITGTVTGRLSCSEPNLQQIPRNGEIKSMFVSRFKDGRIIQVDYNQGELRMLAEYSKDPALMKVFKKGRDIHQETAARCLQKPYDEVTEEERKVIGKKVNFGIVYLISAQGLSEKLPCTLDEAKAYISNWYREFSGVRDWMHRRKEEIIESGRAISLSGRVRRLYGASNETSEGREAIRQGVNSPLQGALGDLTKYNMMRLEKALRKEMKARVICNVHDAVMIDSPKEEVEECIAKINELFPESPWKMEVPMEFDIKVGPNWKGMKDYVR